MTAIELLLECVFSYPILYDSNHRDYKNQHMKDLIWDTIGKELDSSGEGLKKKWKNLRDTYTKYLRSITTGTGNEKKNYKRWKWGPHMEMFKPYLSMSKCETNVAPTSVVKADETNNDLNEVSTEQSTYEREFCTRSSAKRAKRPASITSVDNVVQFSQQHNVPEHDAIDHFMLGLAKTIKTFSHKRQVETKMEISQLVFKKELQQIENDNNFIDETNNSSLHYPWKIEHDI